LVFGASDSPKLAFDLYEFMAKELKAVGININFCPVADIQTNPKNPIIGIRAYGTTEERVSKLVTAAVRGHLVAGVQPCVKHFPGHGDTSQDSHLALPKVDTPLELLREREFRPFVRAFKSRCAMVMTAHILNPALDPELPATLSERVLQDILRKELRYTRLIISDDMEMKAITDHYGADEAPLRAIQAGCDLLIYRSEEAGRKAYAALSKALDEERLAPEVVLQAAQRSREIKKESLLPYHPVAVSEISSKIGLPAGQELIAQLTEAAQR
jgi:beta-N-acetylhexosaminidase